MSAQIIDGNRIARELKDEVKDGVQRLRAERGIVPGLATVLVGEDPASQVYVGMKNRDARDLGLHSRQITLAADTTEAELLVLVQQLNADPAIHGILVQLPLPPQIDEASVLMAIDPAKDVDGFHPLNVGRLSTGAEDVLAPCTPRGVIEILLRTGHDPAGRHCVVVGRSNLVGRPMASLLLRKGRGGDATVTVSHSRTPNLGTVTRLAEILIVAVGRPRTITRDMVRPGAVVIDVGVNRLEDPSSEKGFRLVGDVAFDEVSQIAAAITPVPGGVGPMTRALLMSNTLIAATALAARVSHTEASG
ncbi:MAG TPA: bifunctional 5,10-methylene-tetrahydrofolate dehydrogenase/5,10-methylene-tetrahydrofolate cyclohydrolase [Gemmatimonadetes bacterium]|nr:bifunctional 5,10-methylene-tetrahydrofolate dehydrogenase/5,10-methylene-tetrahydrofolate cyclohydrolase [Gemmatimonadota bacterium]